MTEFTYTNAKNPSTGNMSFKLNYAYHPHVFFGDNVNLHSRSSSANKSTKKIRELMSIYQQNLIYTLKLQTQTYNKGVKPCTTY